MTLETEVAALTAASNALAEAVNVKKADIEQAAQDLSDFSDPIKGAVLVGRGVVSVDSVTGFQTVRKASDLTYSLRGFYSGIIAGGGTFRYDSTVSRNTHNGGTVISPTVPWNGLQASLANFLNGVGDTDPTALGCFVRIHRADVSASWFGAVGDNVIDDTVAVQKAESYANSNGGGVVYCHSTKIAASAVPPANVIRHYIGSPVNRTDMGGSSGLYALNPTYTYIGGPHVDRQMADRYLRTLVKGSGAIGQPYCDQSLAIHIQKEHWSETTGTPQTGELNGMTITVRQGGPRVGSGDVNQGQSSGAAILGNIQATQGAGALQFFEFANTVVNANDLQINRNIGVQCGMLNTRDDDYYGLVLISNMGTQDAAIKIDSAGGSSWGRILENFYGGINNYYIDVLGKHRWRTAGNVNITMEHDATNGDVVFKNNSNAEILRVSQTRVLRGATPPNVQTGTTYSIGSGDHDRDLVLANSAAITATLLKTAPVGTTVPVTQRDAGQVTFAPETGATLRNRQSHTKTAGQYAVVTLRVLANADGNSAIWYLSGDTAA